MISLHDYSRLDNVRLSAELTTRVIRGEARDCVLALVLLADYDLGHLIPRPLPVTITLGLSVLG